MSELTRARDRIAELKRQLAEAQADSERLDREFKRLREYVVASPRTGKDKILTLVNRQAVLNTIDAAIDAARKGEE